MHNVVFSYREILPHELPTVRDLETGTERPMTPAELLNCDIHHLHDNVYACADQTRRTGFDDGGRPIIETVGVQSPGRVIAEGNFIDRHARIPAEHAPFIFRARVIRADDPAVPVTALVAENLAEQTAMLAQYVGDVDGSPLVDLAHPGATLAEAQRLVEIPGNGIERHHVPMAAVTDSDVTEETGIIPHRWATLDGVPHGG